MTNGPSPKAPEHLDGIDLKILSELQDNGRIPINELVSRVGVSRPNGLRRLRSLLRRGVIKAIRAMLDERLLGYGVMSFVSLQLESQSESALRAFEERLAGMSGIQQCWLISGDSDYLLKCVAPDVETMREQLLGFAATPGVRTFRTYLVLGTVKDEPLPIPSGGYRTKTPANRAEDRKSTEA
jgi:DNA-binding Lrp family transcriptional regulator